MVAMSSMTVTRLSRRTAQSLSTFDTNILIYSIDHRDSRKHLIAKRIVDGFLGLDGMVMLQCLNEFYAAATKKRLMSGMDAMEVVQAVRESLDIVAPAEIDLVEAIAASQTHQIPFFDALMWATAKRVGCTTLITEDFQDGRVLGSVTFRNPFNSAFDLYQLLQG